MKYFLQMIDRDWLKFLHEQIEIIYKASKTVLEQVGEKGKSVDMKIDREFITALANHIKLTTDVLNLAKSMLDARLSGEFSKDKS
jgi:hypothetical protein